METIPAEIFVHITSLLSGKDVARLGAASTRLHQLCRDDHLWMFLFQRDIVSMPMYAGNTEPFATDVSIDEAFYERPWPEQATRLWRLYMPGSFELPRAIERCGAAPPGPLARAFALGKDWRWVYIAHARAANRAVPVPKEVTDQLPYYVKSMRAIYMGDSVDAAAAAAGSETYGAIAYVDTESGCIKVWVEGMWRPEHVGSWFVIKYESAADCHMRIGERPDARDFRLEVDEYRRYWSADGDSWSVDELGDGFIRELYCHYNGHTTDTLPNGFVIEYSADRFDITSGIATARFINGDMASVIWHRCADLARINYFVISPMCPDVEFAGKTVYAWDWDWVTADVPIDIAPRWGLGRLPEFGCWPLGDSEDAKLLRRYIAEGRVGWSAQVQEAVMARMRSANFLPA